MRLHNRRIYNLCYRFTNSPDDAQDLTQEVFIRVYRTMGSYNLEKGAFTTWLTTLTRNLLVDHFRRSKQDRVTDSIDAGLREEDDSLSLGDRLEDPSPTPDDRLASKETQKMVQTGAGEDQSGPAGSSDSTGLTRHGLQRDCRGTEGAGGDSEVANKPGKNGTGAITFS